MARNYGDFISAYLKYAQHSEPPLNYHIWTGVSIIASALQRKAYLQWGFKRLYPNMYIVLIGPSGCRKGTAMNIGKDLITELSNVAWASESITRASLIQTIAGSMNSYVDPQDEQTKYHSSLSIFSEELSVFLGQSNTQFLADLTDWFDCQDKWTHRTKGCGVDELVGVCVNILGATAPDWLKSILPPEAFGGGFTSRIIFVVEEGKRQLIADPTLPQDILDMRSKLIEDLESISLITGPFRFHEDTMKFYTNWYVQQAKNPVIKDPLFAGYCERRAVHTLKLSMICSASRSNDRIIMQEDFERAIHLLESVEPKMPRTFMGLGKARYSEMTALIFDYLAKVKKATTAELLEKFHLDLDEYTLQIIIKTLIARQRITARYDASTGQSTYTFKQGGGKEECPE